MKENATYQDGLEPNRLPESLRENPFGVPENYFSDLASQLIAQAKWIERREESVFEVPEGYFDSLPDTLLTKIAIDSLKAQVVSDGFAIPEQYSDKLSEDILHRISEEKLKESIDSDGFTVAADYFDILAQDITANISTQELKLIVPSDGFSVPSGYETSLEESIFSRVAEDVLKQTISTDGFTVPVDYPTTLEEQITVRVFEEKLKLVVPSAGFDIPQHYFDTLSADILSSTQGIDGTIKVIPIHQTGKTKRWYAKYTVAASFIALLGLGGFWGYQNMQQEEEASDNIAKQQLSQHLSEIPKQEIINYLAASASGDDMIYMSQYTDETNLPTQGFGNNISKQEIEDYLNYNL